jgi:diguanylate cyclase (GGDEF)-like protein
MHGAEKLPPGIALDDRGEPHHDWVAAARFGGATFVGAGVLGLISLAMPNADNLVPEVAVATSLTSLALGAVSILLRRRATPLLVYALSVLALGCISVFALFGHREMTADSILPAIGFYLWQVLFVGYFFPRRAVYPAIAATAVAATVVVLVGGLDVSVGTWFVMLGAFCAAGLVVSFLRERVTRLLSVLARAARSDALTGALNRRGFEERFAQEVGRARRSGEPMAVLVIDIDRFKQINDSLGHAVGDDVLMLVAKELRDSVRTSDVVARIGGEEFAVLLPAATREDGVVVAERFRESMSRQIAGLRKGLAVTASVGVAAFPDDGSCRDTLFHHADRAVYTAKDRGRDRIVADPASRLAAREAIAAPAGG